MAPERMEAVMRAGEAAMDAFFEMKELGEGQAG
jgi:hypothetical protein